MFRQRFSPQAFTDPHISKETLMAILEAGTTAPSCFNEQPWRFVLGKKEDFMEILTAGNREWCAALETFVLLCAAPRYGHLSKDGTHHENRWASFDTGTCWGFMTLEGLKRGVYLHAMAGFDREKARERFSLDTLAPQAVIAFGAGADQPPEWTPRKPLEAVIIDRTER